MTRYAAHLWNILADLQRIDSCNHSEQVHKSWFVFETWNALSDRLRWQITDDGSVFGPRDDQVNAKPKKIAKFDTCSKFCVCNNVSASNKFDDTCSLEKWKLKKKINPETMHRERERLIAGAHGSMSSLIMPAYSKVRHIHRKNYDDKVAD